MVPDQTATGLAIRSRITLANQPVNQYGVPMMAIGLFEAKTKLSEICERVAAMGVPVILTRRGRPLVRIEPLKTPRGKRKSVWDRRADYEKKHGPLTEPFELPPKQKQPWRNPLDS